MADGLFGIPTGIQAYQDDQIKLSELATRQKTADANIRLVDAQVANFAADNARLDAAAKDKREAEATDRVVEDADLADYAKITNASQRRLTTSRNIARRGVSVKPLVDYDREV